MNDRYSVGRSVGRGVLWGSLLGGLVIIGTVYPANPVDTPPAAPDDRPAHAWCDTRTTSGTLALTEQINRLLIDGDPRDAITIRQDLLSAC